MYHLHYGSPLRIIILLCIKVSSCRNTFLQAEWMAPEVLRNEPSDEKYGFHLFNIIFIRSFTHCL